MIGFLPSAVTVAKLLLYMWAYSAYTEAKQVEKAPGRIVPISSVRVHYQVTILVTLQKRKKIYKPHKLLPISPTFL